MLEFLVIMKVTKEPLPATGTEPVPVQSVHVQTVHPSVTGLVTLHVTEVPFAYV